MSDTTSNIKVIKHNDYTDYEIEIDEKRPLRGIVEIYNHINEPIPTRISDGRTLYEFADIKFDFTEDDYIRSVDFLELIGNIMKQGNDPLDKDLDLIYEEIIPYTEEFEAKLTGGQK